MRPPVCNGVSVMDMSVGPHDYKPKSLLTHDGLVFEYVDQGAYHYRHFFNAQGECCLIFNLKFYFERILNVLQYKFFI